MRRSVAAVARTLGAGRLIVYPTDTLLGLGARGSDPAAVARLAEAKGRPSGQPTSVMVSSVPELEALATLAPAGRRFVRRHLPGPYTVLVRPSPFARSTLAPRLFGPRGTLGVRIPDHALARAIARASGPVTATSANRHGEPPATTVAAARRAFGRSVALYVGGGPPPSGRPSTLVDLSGARPRFLARG